MALPLHTYKLESCDVQLTPFSKGFKSKQCIVTNAHAVRVYGFIENTYKTKLSV